MTQTREKVENDAVNGGLNADPLATMLLHVEHNGSRATVEDYYRATRQRLTDMGSPIPEWLTEGLEE